MNPERSLKSVAEAATLPKSHPKQSKAVRGTVSKAKDAPANEPQNPLDRFLQWLIDFFSSLRLTVFCLGLGLILVFWGTLAQVEIGTFKAQNEFFRSFFIFWGPKGAAWKVPIFPGGYLVGGVLLINLVTAHFRRFKLTKKKIGIWMIHIGVILLLLGQLLTDILSRETHMWLSEGQTKRYSESGSQDELAVIDTTDPAYDDIVAFPESLARKQQELRHPRLPFSIRVKDYFPNSEPQLRAPMIATEPPQANQGIGKLVDFAKEPITTATDRRNIPAAIVEVLGEDGSLGTWSLSNWLVEEKLVQILRSGFRRQAGEPTVLQLNQALGQAQEFSYRGRTYQIALRPVRFYKPFGIQLLKFSHDLYRGTEIPKNFASRVRLIRPDSAEDREVLIYMNSPLRYSGETFYQSGFDDVDPRVTILQVVHNPSWLTPYFSCVLVGVGLVVQFCTGLFGFAFKRKTARTA